jgi:hypothetical protein
MHGVVAVLNANHSQSEHVSLPLRLHSRTAEDISSRIWFDQKSIARG